MSAENGASSSTVIGLTHQIPIQHGAARRADSAPRAAQHRHPAPAAHMDAAVAETAPNGSRVELDLLLPPNELLTHLSREKRRTERSKTPLSMVLYRLNGAAAGDADRLLDVLHTAKRETDILGHLAGSQIVVLCPDTDQVGIQAFRKKIDSQVGGLPIDSAAATYPGHLFDRVSDGATASDLPPALLADTPGIIKHGYSLKRSIDIVGALLALVLFAPLMIVVAVLIALTSRGPVIYMQPRLGKGAVPFQFYKFRSMVANNDDRAHREFVAKLINKRHGDGSADQCGEQPSYKLKADPRVTPIGRIIRKTSIDELPQLINVLKGDMSLVGPRPPIPYEASNYDAWHLRRLLSVRPGITGLWQVEGRSRVGFNDMVRMDLRYIRGCSLSMDMRILLKNLIVVLRCEGAV